MPAWPCCRRSFSRSIHELNQTHRSSKPPHLKSLVISISVIGTALVLVLLLVLFFFRFCKSGKSRVGRVHLTDRGQGSLRKLQKFSYRDLKKATNGFNETQKLGKGGYGIVYRGLLKSGEEVAVKKLVLSSLQGEREFQNELSICRRLDSRYIVKLLGFSTHGEKVRLLVYECMQNRSLQEALLEKHTSVHLDWGRRFSIILDIARALSYLHLDCHPSIVHGDVKPSNVLLDGNFRAYLADFGLARTKVEEQKTDQASERFKSDVSENEFGTPESFRVMKSRNKEGGSVERKQSKPVVEERVMASFGDQSLPSSYLGSPHSGIRCSTDVQVESEIPGSTILPLVGSQIHRPDQIHRDLTVAAGDHSHTLMQREELMNNRAENGILDHHMPPLPAQQVPLKASSKDNWWWKQENSGELKVRDYVMEWMRSELSANENKKASDSDHQMSSQHQTMGTDEGTKEVTNRKKERQEQQRKKKLKAMEEEIQKEVDQAKKKERAKARAAGRKGREWWKDEYFAELSRKKGSGMKGSNANELNTKGDGGANLPVWVFRLRDTYSGERRGRGDSATETAASDDLSSTTTSMRGTVCYVAPEFGGVGVLSEASDIYSFGVLLLVIISGRRPIEIMAANNATVGTSSTSLGSSPTARRFERANLITWARSLAYSGNVLDLVDDRLHGAYVREQAQLCISLALLCIRRLPSARPSIVSVVKALSGETPLPPLPVEFSPSPPSRLSLHQSPLRAASYVSSSEENV